MSFSASDGRSGSQPIYLRISSRGVTGISLEALGMVFLHAFFFRISPEFRIFFENYYLDIPLHVFFFLEFLTKFLFKFSSGIRLIDYPKFLTAFLSGFLPGKKKSRNWSTSSRDFYWSYHGTSPRDEIDCLQNFFMEYAPMVQLEFSLFFFREFSLGLLPKFLPYILSDISARTLPPRLLPVCRRVSEWISCFQISTQDYPVVFTKFVLRLPSEFFVRNVWSLFRISPGECREYFRFEIYDKLQEKSGINRERVPSEITRGTSIEITEGIRGLPLSEILVGTMEKFIITWMYQKKSLHNF